MQGQSMKKSGLIVTVAVLMLMLTCGMAKARQNASAPGQTRGLTLEQAFETALKENEQVGISRQDLVNARTDITSATSNLYPQLSLRGAHNRQKDSDLGRSSAGAGISALSTPENYNTLTLQLDQHIYQWGKVWSARKIAEHYYDGSRYRHLRRVQEILYQVSVQYYEVLLGRRAIEIAENALNRAVQQLERAEARFQVGVLTETDVLRAEVQVAQSREQLERAKNQYDIAIERLALEMGVDSINGPVREPDERTFQSAPISELFSTAMANRPDFDQAARELQAADERVDYEKADYFPNLSLNAQYIRTDEKSLFYGEHDDWNASLVLSYPLFTGWQTTAEVDRARSEKSQAQYSLSRLRKQIRNEVRSVYLDIKTQQKVIDQLKQQVRSAKRNYKQVSAQFKEGLVTAVDQVDAFTALNEAENRLAQAYYTYQLDLIRLDLSTGTFQSDLLEKEIFNENG
ncbi:MAG: TolC family protein [Desulfobacterales bacterium]|nr:TolC family protein [Desulfobacterales bacterium]